MLFLERNGAFLSDRRSLPIPGGRNRENDYGRWREASWSLPKEIRSTLRKIYSFNRRDMFIRLFYGSVMVILHTNFQSFGISGEKRKKYKLGQTSIVTAGNYVADEND